MIERDRRKFDVVVNGHPFKGLFKNRAAYEVVRVAVLELGIHPQDILDSTSEGRRPGRRARPILQRLPGELTSDEVRRVLLGRAETLHKRYYIEPQELLRVGSETWIFTTGWSGAEVEGFFAELSARFPGITISYQESQAARSPT